MGLQKARWGTWLLLSLIPNGFAGFISFVIFAFANNSPDDPEGWAVFWALVVVISWATWWLALLGGIVLKVWAGSEKRRLYREARQYADLHGWQQISDTAWKSFKRNNLVMSVTQAYEKPTYILSVEQEGETVATDGFSRSYYALHFADFLWEHVLSARANVDISVVQQTRGEWERQTRALTSGR